MEPVMEALMTAAAVTLGPERHLRRESDCVWCPLLGARESLTARAAPSQDHRRAIPERRLEWDAQGSARRRQAVLRLGT